MRRRAAALAVALALLAAGCSAGPDRRPEASGTGEAAAADPTGSRSADVTEDAGGDEPGDEAADAGEPDDHGSAGPAGPARPLRAGERRRTVAMPTAYRPSAPTANGTDDYRCFVLDPGLAEDTWLTGTSVLPGNADVVHHVILFRLPEEQLAEAEARDAASEGPGWTCFGGSGVGGPGLDDAPWLAAWAPGGGESVHPRGLGVPLEAGTRIIMQVHYNLLAGDGEDVSSAVLRTAPGGRDLTPLHTMLLPAPVELPCRERYADGPLCEREAAMADVQERFGGPRTNDLLHLLCGTPVRPSGRTRCDRSVSQPTTVRAVAGHMHLLGREIRVVANPGTPRERVLLDIDVWDFDDQGARRVRPLALRPGDRVRVSCRHVQWLRDELPAFEGQPDRYVVWGEGSTDEMCLGTLLVTRP